MHNEAERHLERIADFTTHFVVAGAGEPLLLIHGIGSSIIPWHDSIEVFAKHFRVSAMDLPGHGRSEKAADISRYTIAEAVRFLNEFCEALGLERVNIIGRSMGGLLALAFALEHPERIKKLVLSGSGGLGREASVWLRLPTLPYVGEVFAHPTRRMVRRSWEWLFYDKRLIPKDLVEEDYHNQNIPGNKEALLAMLRYGIDLRGQKDHVVFTDRLYEIQAPALIVWGKNDRVIPWQHGARAARLLPNAQFQFFDHCGHFPQIEKKDDFHEALLAFLLEK